MAVEIPASHKDLLDRPIVVTLATTMPDGTPQATPVWFDYVDGIIRINTARGRQKDNNMENRPNVSVLSVDPNNPYRYLEVRGKITEITEEGAVDHIELLSRRYMNQPYYTEANPQGSQVRVIYKIEPTRVLTRG